MQCTEKWLLTLLASCLCLHILWDHFKINIKILLISNGTISATGRELPCMHWRCSCRHPFKRETSILNASGNTCQSPARQGMYGLPILFWKAANIFVPHQHLTVLPAHRTFEVLQSSLMSQNISLIIQNILRRDLIHCHDGRECGKPGLRQSDILGSLLQGYCDGGGENKICCNQNRNRKYLQWIIHNHIVLHGLSHYSFSSRHLFPLLC